jgi:hypothetical protein
MRIGGAVKNDINFCKRLLQVMKSSMLTLLPYPRDILGRLPEGKTDRVLWNELSLRVLQGNDHSLWEAVKLKHSKVWIGKIFVFLYNCAPAHWSVLAAATCQAQYCGALVSFRLFWAHIIKFISCHG